MVARNTWLLKAVYDLYHSRSDLVDYSWKQNSRLDMAECSQAIHMFFCVTRKADLKLQRLYDNEHSNYSLIWLFSNYSLI